MSVRAQLFKKCKETLLLLLAPHVPHICEELWERLGKKDFISLAEWPEWDPKMIDEQLEKRWIALDTVEDDVRNIQKITKTADFKSMILIVADDWKTRVLRASLAEFEKGKKQGDIMKSIMQDATLKPKGKQINTIVDKVVKIPANSLPPSLARRRIHVLRCAKEMLTYKLNCTVTVVKNKNLTIRRPPKHSGQTRHSLTINFFIFSCSRPSSSNFFGGRIPNSFETM